MGNSSPTSNSSTSKTNAKEIDKARDAIVVALPLDIFQLPKPKKDAAFSARQVLLQVYPPEKHLGLLLLKENMLEATDLFASIIRKFKTFLQKIATNTTKCEAL